MDLDKSLNCLLPGVNQGLPFIQYPLGGSMDYAYLIIDILENKILKLYESYSEAELEYDDLCDAYPQAWLEIMNAFDIAASEPKPLCPSYYGEDKDPLDYESIDCI